MRIQLEDSVDVPTAGATHIAEHLIRFQFAEERPISPYHRALLEGIEDARGILPEAPNRAGIQQNLDQLRRQLEETWKAHETSAALTFAAVGSPADLVRLNIDHCCRPRHVYMNGQAVMTLVERRERLFEAAPHPRMEDVLRFGSIYGPWTSIDPARIRHYSTLSAAETWIRASLSHLSVRALSMVRGGEKRTLLLQAAGFTRDEKGYTVEVYLAHFEGQVRRLRRFDEEPYGFLNRLVLDGFRPEACATCRSFRFSGMSRDMSGGSKGYCGMRRERAQAPSSMTVVSVFDACGEHSFIEDEAREVPYLRGPRGGP
jgi:hypothetical protein